MAAPPKRGALFYNDKQPYTKKASELVECPLRDDDGQSKDAAQRNANSHSTVEKAVVDQAAQTSPLTDEDAVIGAKGKKETSEGKSDKARIDDLKDFARNFKLQTPIPFDLVEILTKDEVRQLELIDNQLRSIRSLNVSHNITEDPQTSNPTTVQRHGVLYSAIQGQRTPIFPPSLPWYSVPPLAPLQTGPNKAPSLVAPSK
ncbi:hypothetical protein K432DRAFT_408849 [Lepidopterella palustris CBS 459.81]|uniref:Uncharacterized protein n=1 Tax=Lepidopterella palustris CBS 459.81 TaxID=1314670 RepID=A0A8E2E1G1_9PEZI|nr:hypothetical protein K432DRAFT_408849 [Lepidopterella palustris CBS 459.81]